ncbi:hypothetical protein D3C84_1207340 [compost metagenome]
MTAVNKIHQLLGIAVSAGRCIITGNLITPGLIKRMFVKRHQLNMGISHLGCVGNQLLGKLIVGEEILFPLQPPGTGMHFVN